MKGWKIITNKALLGTSKLPLRVAELPAEVTEGWELADTSEAEADFIRYAAFVYQYRQAGCVPIDFTHIHQSTADQEQWPYCSAQANDVLKAVLAEDLPKFVELWLSNCRTGQQLVRPEMVPTLLDLARKRKELRNLIAPVVGKRGEWLASLIDEWNFLSNEPADVTVTWENGTLDERKEALREYRLQKPVEALALLQSTWATEGANEKAAFLEILQHNCSATDLPWLEGLKEKGQKVNGALAELLSLIPTSSLIGEYRKALESVVTVSVGKSLLGILSKNTLHVSDDVSFPESIFKSGIEKLSSDKKVTDHQYIVAQLLMRCPPAFLQEHLKLAVPEIVELFKKEKQGYYLNALAHSSTRFKDAPWAKVLLDQAGDFLSGISIISLLETLSHEERETMALRYMKEKPVEVVQLMLSSDRAWSPDLAKAILKYTAGEIYQYNKNFFRPAAALIPVTMMESLESFAPGEETKKVHWKNQSEELNRLLTLKKQIMQSFHA